VWAVIPARGGSKTIPLKNMALLAGRPLIDYVITAAKATPAISRIICSTDDETIMAFCRRRGVEAQRRPEALCRDDVSTTAVIEYVTSALLDSEGAVADIIVPLEPTSPFVLPEHIEGCISQLLHDASADSAQTIAPVEHTRHAYNQRRLNDGEVSFVFPDERRRFYNKQLKPRFFIHGNARAVRSRCLLEQGGLFGARSLPVVIDRLYALDVDGPEDFPVAECLIRCGLVTLPASDPMTPSRRGGRRGSPGSGGPTGKTRRTPRLW
jgi:CMP-N-acetylneuraminic acid synthetase